MIPETIPALTHVPGIRAFFTTRRGGKSRGAFASLNLSFYSGDDTQQVRRNWKRLMHAQGLGGKKLALPRLSHEAECLEIASALRQEPAFGIVAAAPAATDAVFTHDPEWLLAVTAGDCLTAWIADAPSHCIGVVHAGWRGSRDNILGRTLARLFAARHCRPDSTWVALGPCLSTRALEVPQALADTLPSTHVHGEGGHFFFDLRGCNRAQARAAGLDPSRIFDVAGCTRDEPERFFSYRRDGAASGRMAACIAFEE